MPVTLTSTNPLKQSLLTGTSAAVIVMALAVAAPTGAMAQEIAGDGAGGGSTSLTGVVINEVAGNNPDFGIIDANVDATLTSITIRK